MTDNRCKFQKFIDMKLHLGEQKIEKGEIQENKLVTKKLRALKKSYMKKT